jgi:competence protein ComEA
VWKTSQIDQSVNDNNNNQPKRKENKTMRKSLPLHVLITTFLVASIGVAAMAAESQSAAGVVNINTADAAQLSLLPRVGARAAQRIVDYRNEHGAFKKATDLMQVKGFGDKSFERLSQYIVVEGKTTMTAKVRSPRKPRSSKASTSRPNPAG